MKIKIVLVDDAPFIREIVKNLLKETEIQVVGEADDGEKAVELVLNKIPDVVLMDIILPKKSGIQAAQEIKEKHPDIRILACSTMDQEEIMIKALEVGCSDYIVKPFQGHDLVESIRKVARKE